MSKLHVSLYGASDTFQREDAEAPEVVQWNPTQGYPTTEHRGSHQLNDF